MTSEPMSKVLALLICFSIFILPVSGAASVKNIPDLEEERLRALIAENKKAAQKKAANKKKATSQIKVASK